MKKFAVIVVTLLGNLGLAEAAPVEKVNAPASTQAKATPDSPLPYATSAFDPAVEILPANYRGNDCRAVAQSLASLNLAKDEFETTAAYNERLAGLGSKKVDGALTVSDYFVFVQESPPVFSTYDADSGTLKIGGPPPLRSATIGKTRNTLIVTQAKIAGTSTYSASNAYGKTVEVYKTEFDVCGLALSDLRYPNAVKNTSATITMTPDEARAAKGNIGIMFVGKLAPPYRVKFYDALSPTINAPLATAWSGDVIVMQSVQAWIFNKVTGKVYQRGNL